MTEVKFKRRRTMDSRQRRQVFGPMYDVKRTPNQFRRIMFLSQSSTPYAVLKMDTDTSPVAIIGRFATLKDAQTFRDSSEVTTPIKEFAVANAAGIEYRNV